jgi:hypothetical protein
VIQRAITGGSPADGGTVSRTGLVGAARLEMVLWSTKAFRRVAIAEFEGVFPDTNRGSRRCRSRQNALFAQVIACVTFG